MKSISLEQLLEAGCHFGHQVTRQNPKARDYVFEERDNIHIIDLEKTKEGLDEAGTFVRSSAAKPEATMVILGSKRQAQEIVKSEVQRAKSEGADGLYSVTNRWIGGTFTNFGEVAKNFKRLEEIDTLFASSVEKAKYTKKELLLMEREKQKLLSFYSGLLGMAKIPDVLYIIDTHAEFLAVREGKAMGVKVVGITDTNADPTVIDYAIPANDDAVGSIQLITGYIIDAWIEGKKQAAKSAEVKEEAAKGEEGKDEKQSAKSVPSTPSVNSGQGLLRVKAQSAEKKEKEPKEEKKAQKKEEAPKSEAKPQKTAKPKKKAEEAVSAEKQSA